MEYHQSPFLYSWSMDTSNHYRDRRRRLSGGEDPPSKTLAVQYVHTIPVLYPRAKHQVEQEQSRVLQNNSRIYKVVPTVVRRKSTLLLKPQYLMKHIHAHWPTHGDVLNGSFHSATCQEEWIASA